MFYCNRPCENKESRQGFPIRQLDYDCVDVDGASEQYGYRTDLAMAMPGKRQTDRQADRQRIRDRDSQKREREREKSS